MKYSGSCHTVVDHNYYYGNNTMVDKRFQDPRNLHTSYMMYVNQPMGNTRIKFNTL